MIGTSAVFAVHHLMVNVPTDQLQVNLGTGSPSMSAFNGYGGQ